MKGGQLDIVCAYAVQGGRDFIERHSFYDAFSSYYSKFNVHGPKLIVGDLNARLHAKRNGEEEILGDNVFGNPLAAEYPLSNRSLLMQLCVRHHLVLADTVLDHELERTVTYHKWGVQPIDTDITCKKLAQLDLFPIGVQDIGNIQDVCADQSVGIASYHFLILAV